MSTLKEISESKITITIPPEETIIESAVKDIITFSLLGVCIYISKDSIWWTIVCGVIFFILAWGWLIKISGTRANTFKNKEDAVKYLTDLEI